MFTLFKADIEQFHIPDVLSLTTDIPHELCLLAAKELQQHLSQNQFFNHNFGLKEENDSAIIGKMFGVLVVKLTTGNLGYLSGFSGKLGGKNTYTEFVPPVFDLLTEGSFLNAGMQKLTRMNEEIKATKLDHIKLKELKAVRRIHSATLQNKIFDQYHLLNQAGMPKSLRGIFNNAGYKNPPAGAGECAGIKLLQYAFLHNMKPLALAEFWWGQSPKSATWKHSQFYPCCKEKCEPILQHMLS
ncbi:MAG: pseudouridylate synthase [Pedobacter sp.]|nr:pseudouridylate synthase [Pedobacter sp.]